MSSGHGGGPSKVGLLLIGVLFVVIIIIVVSFFSHPLSAPNYLNLEYFFSKILEIARAAIAYLSQFSWLDIIRTICSIIAIFFITAIIYIQVLLREMHAKDHHGHGEDHEVPPDTSHEKKKNPKWQNVLTLGFSQNPSDWRFAIIEADSMLDEMTIVLGYQGESLGERLKQVDPADWRTIREAWDAHMVRNKIAHNGSDFILDQDEARRVLGQYERVFKEFDYI